MLGILVAVLISAMEPLNCENSSGISSVVAEILPEGKSINYEVGEQSPSGYIHSLFVPLPNNVMLYLEGWFFEDEKILHICHVEFFIEFDAEGDVIRVWHREQKEM